MLREPLSPHIKLTFGVCTMIGIAAFVFGAIRMQRNIALPFTRDTNVVYKTNEELKKEREEKLKATDTDADTIVDYDEMFIYKTSPFLSDTDSDGIDDNIEIGSGQDPNCPKGSTCRQQRTETASAETSTTPEGSGGATQATTKTDTKLSAEQIAQAVIAIFGPLDKLTPEGVKAKTESLSTTDLHNFLLAVGLPQETIDKTDEQTLRKIVSDTIAELATSAAQPQQ